MSQSGTPGLQEENLQGSWVELHFSNNGNGSSIPASASIYNGDLEKILLDAQHESGRSSSKSSHCDRWTPQDTNRASEIDAHSVGEKNSSQSEEDYIERRKEVESILKKNSDWIWDWSSRPENIPPKELLFKHPKRTATLSMRNTSVMKKGGLFSAEFLKVFLPSLLLSHLLAIGLGDLHRKASDHLHQHLLMKNQSPAFPRGRIAVGAAAAPTEACPDPRKLHHLVL
ncbi:BCL2/adenovirus E1B 19 kDa protein-interacting protein 3 [Prionailurus iriomotensis]